MPDNYIPGFEGQILYKIGGLDAAGAMIELTNARDVTPSNEASEQDVTTRGSGGFRELVPTLITMGVEFEMIDDPSDTNYSDFRNAFYSRSLVGIRILNRPEADGGIGCQGDFRVFRFSRNEGVDAVQTVSVTLKPTRGGRHIELYP